MLVRLFYFNFREKQLRKSFAFKTACVSFPKIYTSKKKIFGRKVGNFETFRINFMNKAEA